MKRFVNVPDFLALHGMPTEAQKLSEEAQLPIRISADCSSICIVSIPEVFELESAKEVKTGHIYWLDVTDEYHCFDKNPHIIYYNGNIEIKSFPVVKEKHVLRFRNRFYNKGNYKYSITNNDKVIHEGSFVVL